VNRLSKLILLGIVFLVSSGWGFFAHQKINRLAVFILPPDMIGFYKKNIQYVSEAAVNPDRRRYAVHDEGARHYIDLDSYGDHVTAYLPRSWEQAVKKFGQDSLTSHGILPWHIQHMYYRLREAFMIVDPEKILRLSAELGHYVADAHVPLHTTSNYDGQKTGQYGIHAFWESRLPELYFSEYDFLVGRARYLDNVLTTAWSAVMQSHEAVDSVLVLEQQLYTREGEKKFNFETKGRQTVKVVSAEYARSYHQKLAGMVERRFRASLKMTGDIWYTAWVDAGQPDLKSLLNYKPSEDELKNRVEELKLWKAQQINTRAHEHDTD
jgi:hypothetical protein